MSDFVRGLKCRLCGKAYPKQPLNYCEDDFGPLEVDYDYDAIGESINRGKIEMRPFNMWRYRELLPIDGEPTVGPLVGGTPLVKAHRLGEAIGVENLWIKNDAVNFPTLSFKDPPLPPPPPTPPDSPLTTPRPAPPRTTPNS